MSNRVRIGDDVVMAFVDGALPAAAADKIKPFIQADHDCRRRASALREIWRLAHSAFQDVLDEPLPQELRRALSSDTKPHSHSAPPPERQRPAAAPPASQVADERTSPTRAMARTRARRRRAATLAVVLFLACLSALAGFWLGQERAALRQSAAVEPPPIQLDVRILPGSLPFRALETKRSDEPVAEGLLSARVRFSYWDAGGRVCRQYEVAGGSSALIGVACRLPDGRWQPQVVVEGRLENGELRTLPGGRDKLQGYIAQSAGSGRIGEDEESDLIARGW